MVEKNSRKDNGYLDSCLKATHASCCFFSSWAFWALRLRSWNE